MPKYEEIASALRAAIRNGEYTPGQQLAFEKDMCVQYGVSRITIKRAVDELVKEGLIVKRRGSGTFVKSLKDEDVKELSMANQLSGYVATYKGKKVHTDVVRFDIIHPSADIAAKLQITTEDFVYDIIRVRYLEGEATVVEYTKMPIELIQGIKMQVLKKTIYGYIENTLKLHIQSAHRTVRAKMPTDEEREWLKIDGEMPILEVEQVAFLDDGVPFEYSVSHHRADKSEFRSVSIR